MMRRKPRTEPRMTSGVFGAFLSQSGSVTGLAKNVKIPVLGTHFILKRRMKRFFHPSGKFHPNL